MLEVIEVIPATGNNAAVVLKVFTVCREDPVRDDCGEMLTRGDEEVELEIVLAVVSAP